MDLWNVKNLEPPPIITAIADVKEIDLKLLRNTLKDAVDFFENQPHLFTEAAMLSRTIYRMKMKFRSSKDLKALQMLNRALRIYLHLQIPKVLKSFLDSIPQIYKAKKTYLPSKHMIDFVLVRIQSLGKTLMKIYGHCKNAAMLAQQRLRLGHFWKMAIIFYAMSARIFVITKSLIKYTCELYTNLLPFASKLNNSGKHWLPAGYEFPESLNEWLEIDWVDLETAAIEIPDDEPHTLSYFDLIDDSDDDIEFCDEYILVRDDLSATFDMSDEKKETADDSVIEIIEQTPSRSERHDEIISLCDESLPSKEIRITDGFKGFCEDVDVGEIVQIDDDQTLLPKEKTIKQKAHNQKGDVINLSKVETPPNIKQRHRNRFDMSDKKKKTSEESVIEIIEQTPSRSSNDERHDEIISLCDTESLPPKEISITDGFSSFSEDVDVGEIVQVDDDQTLLDRIVKMKAHNQKAADADVINHSAIETSPNIKQKNKKKKKIGGNKNPQTTPKDDMKIMNQKTNSNSDLDCSIVSLTDSESSKGKKRKRRRSKNKINSQENIKHPNTSGYNLNMASASTEEAKQTQASVPTLTNSNKKQKRGSFKNKVSVQENIFNSDMLNADCSVISLTDSESPKGKKRKRGRSKNKINCQENIEQPNMTSASTEEAKKTQASVSTLTNSNKIQNRGSSKNNMNVQENIFNSDMLNADCSIISLTDSNSPKRKKRKRGRSKNKTNHQENIQHPNSSGYDPNMASASTEETKKTQVSVPTLTNSNKKQKRGRPKSKIGSVQKNDANVPFSERPGAVAKSQSNAKNTKLHDRIRESVRIKQSTYKAQNYKSMASGNSNDTYKVVEEHIQTIKKKKKKKNGVSSDKFKTQLPIRNTPQKSSKKNFKRH